MSGWASAVSEHAPGTLAPLSLSPRRGGLRDLLVLRGGGASLSTYLEPWSRRRLS